MMVSGIVELAQMKTNLIKREKGLVMPLWCQHLPNFQLVVKLQPQLKSACRF